MSRECVWDNLIDLGDDPYSAWVWNDMTRRDYEMTWSEHNAADLTVIFMNLFYNLNKKLEINFYVILDIIEKIFENIFWGFCPFIIEKKNLHELFQFIFYFF